MSATRVLCSQRIPLRLMILSACDDLFHIISLQAQWRSISHKAATLLWIFMVSANRLPSSRTQLPFQTALVRILNLKRCSTSVIVCAYLCIDCVPCSMELGSSVRVYMPLHGRRRMCLTRVSKPMNFSISVERKSRKGRYGRGYEGETV